MFDKFCKSFAVGFDNAANHMGAIVYRNIPALFNFALVLIVLGTAYAVFSLGTDMAAERYSNTQAYEACLTFHSKATCSQRFNL